MMKMMHSSPEDYMRLYLCALSSLVKYAEWKASSWPPIPKKSPLNFYSSQPCEASKTCKPKEEVLLPPKVIITPHEKENPSQQELGTPPNQPLQEEISISPHVQCLPVMGVANPSDPPKDHQEPSDESDSTPIHDPRSSGSPEL